jgi:DNA polymerase (family X)
MAWTNTELGRAFDEIVTLLKLRGEDPFRVRAYERAADAVRAATVDLGTLDAGQLAALKGIGASTATKIRQFVETGTMPMLEQLRAEVPAGLAELTRIPGLGPKTARLLHAELGIDSLDGLRAAIESERLRGLKGLGAKTEANIREAIARMGAKDSDRLPAADVLDVARELCARLAAVPGVQEVAYTGSLRRMRETVGDLDFLVASRDPEPVMTTFRAPDLAVEVLAAGEKKTSVLSKAGLQADLRVVEPEAWGAAMVYFTGSKAHNIRIRERAVRRGLTLNEYGLHDKESGERIAGRTEAEVYAALDLPFIPAPMREDAGEVEAAADGRLPRVVELADLQGELHGHSDWSGDGKASLEEMVAAAAARGYAYWAVTDHAENLRMNGLDRAAMLERRRAIEALQERHEIRILDAVELNIGIDGTVDYDEDFLARFDFCVASVHTLLNRPEAEQTARTIAAMAHPSVHAIGHPTGRKIGRRPGYELDLDAVIEAALRTGTALEVNASPRRLDLSAEHVRRAVEAGVTLTISSDAHSIGDLDSIAYGVATAQRGWAQPGDVLNTRPVEEVLAFAAAKRG